MYNNPYITSAVGTSSLAATGLELGWTLVAGITLLFVGLAVKNILPKKKVSEE